MVNGSAGPPTEFSPSLRERLDDEPVDTRVYRVALTLREPTRVADIADRADCSANAARRHLNRFVDIGLLDKVVESPATFQRNESYFDWRRRDRLSKLSDAELADRIEALLSEDAAYREQYDASRPRQVDPLTFDDPEAVWHDLTAWAAIRREIDDLRTIRDDLPTDEGIA